MNGMTSISGVPSLTYHKNVYHLSSKIKTVEKCILIQAKRKKEKNSNHNCNKKGEKKNSVTVKLDGRKFYKIGTAIFLLRIS